MIPPFDDSFAGPAEYAQLYHALGLQVVPAHEPGEVEQWKRPLGRWKDYSRTGADQATFDSWYTPPHGRFQARPNMGLLTGACSSGVFVIDLDVHKTPAAAQWWAGLLALHNNGSELETPAQTTGGGGRQLLFRAPPGWAPPTAKTTLGVDIRGEGGFAMLPPSNHESGKVYAWDAGRAPHECEIATAPAWLCQAIDALCSTTPTLNYDAPPKPNGASHIVPPNPGPINDQKNFAGLRQDLREEDMRDRIWHAVVNLYRESPIKPIGSALVAAAQACFAEYLQDTKSRLPPDGRSNAERLEAEGRGWSLFQTKWQAAMDQWDGKVAAAAKEAEPDAIARARSKHGIPNRPPSEAHNEPIQANQEIPAHDPETGEIHAQGPQVEQESPPQGDDWAPPPPPGALPVSDAFPIDASAIPRRDWIIPGLLLRGHLSILVAPPGTGKSLIGLQFAIANATGREWAGYRPARPTRTLIVNMEDDLDEMRRRLYAAAQIMQVPQDELAGQIFLAEKPETLVIAEQHPKTREILMTDLADRLAATIKAKDIGTVCIDPLSESHRLDENSNNDVKEVAVAWRTLARATHTAVLAIHHTPKRAGGMAGDADAARGGSALVGTARIVATLFGMTPEEAQALQIEEEERKAYVRLDDAKANYSLIGEKRWLKKQSVDLPNGTLGTPGDQVGVLVPWTPPGAFDGISNAQLNRVLDIIARGPLDKTGQTQGALFYDTGMRAGSARDIVAVVAETLEVEHAVARQVVGAWKKSGLLVQTTYQNVHRVVAKGYRIDDAKRPSI